MSRFWHVSCYINKKIIAGRGWNAMLENHSLPHFIMQSIEKHQVKVYLQFEEQRVTYEDLHHRITRAIAGLYELGIQKGDKVCIMLHNTPEYLDVWFALSFMGAITVPLNVHLKETVYSILYLTLIAS